MICPQCKFDNPQSLLYCGKCGSKLDPSADSSVSSTRTLQMPVQQFKRGSIFANRFEVIEEIGKGGMGTVYRVLDKTISEEVALKLIKPEIAADRKTIDRFKNELKLARKISHKNICRMHDINEESDMPYITMEYVPGEDLKSFLRRAGQLSVTKAMGIIKQTCAGLAEAHRLGVIHRDLKPQNIMIDRDGNVRIMDFGIARTVSSAQLTEEGAVIGTPDYMSPEQVDGMAADERADIYSLGVMLYEMVTGRLHFTGDSRLSIALKHKTEIPRDPLEINPQIPSRLAQLIAKCMDKNRQLRFQHASDLQAELIEIEKDLTEGPALTLEEKPEAPQADKRKLMTSIAVLPFKDMSSQQDQMYFCEGLAEELINALTQIKDLKVASRTSSFSFKDKETDIREIGKVLNVGSVLEGSVQKSGNRLRITAQLISVADGYHLWSQRFDRTADDIFAIQDEISMAVVEMLKGELQEEEKAKVTKHHTQNKDALNLYLKGLYFWNRRFHGDMIRAVDFYQRAIDKDPEYALPYVGIANVFNIMGQWGFIHPGIAYAKSKELLQKVLTLDSSLSELYSSLGFLCNGYEWDPEATEKNLLKSLDLNPQNVYAHAWYGEILATQRRDEEALAEAEKAIELEPVFSLIRSLYGVVLSIIGRPEEGREHLVKSIALGPEQPMPYLFLGMMYLRKPAVPEKAIEYLEKAVEFGLHFGYGWLGAAYALSGQQQKALGVLDKLEEIEKERYLPPLKQSLMYLKPGLKHFRFMKKRYVPPLLKVVIFLGLDRHEEALAHLEESCQVRDFFLPPFFTLVKLSEFPRIDEFAASPKFQKLKKKVLPS